MIVGRKSVLETGNMIQELETESNIPQEIVFDRLQ